MICHVLLEEPLGSGEPATLGVFADLLLAQMHAGRHWYDLGYTGLIEWRQAISLGGTGRIHYGELQGGTAPSRIVYRVEEWELIG